MSRFAPVRTSSPSKPTPASPATLVRNVLEESRSSTLSVPELIALTPEEIDFIDAVIQRAPPNATTFLTVFKAYNDILQERGVDPQHEVVYYGKLLKLGTLKGGSWAEKWAMVKQQQITGPVADPTVRPRPVNLRAEVLTRLTGTLKKLSSERDSDALTFQSTQDDVEVATTTGITEPDVEEAPRYYGTPRPGKRASSPVYSSISNSLGLHVGPEKKIARSAKGKEPVYPASRRWFPPRNAPPWDAETSENTVDTTGSPSTIPPSYGAATRGHDVPQRVSFTPLRALAQAHERAASGERSPTRPLSGGHVAPPSAAREIVAKARERRGGVINEEDAWKKIREAQDEEDADRWREERLVERCWNIWKQGYEWVTTTNEQIGQARDNLVVRLAIHKWRNLAAARREVYQRVTTLDNTRRMRLAFQLWKIKLKEKRQIQWQNDMRSRMKIVRESREMKLKKDQWAKWRQAYRSHLSDQHFAQRLAVRFFSKWRSKLASLSQLEAACDMFIEGRDGTQLERCWELWKRQSLMRKAEATISERVAVRVMSEAVDLWKRRLERNHVADQFYDKVVLKRALNSWKASKDRIRVLEKRAIKYVSRQDDILVRAVMRVWKAHERGRLLERVRTVRLLKQSWTVWQDRLRQHRQLEDLALAFATRASSALAQTAMDKWKQVHLTLQNSQAFAVHYHSARLTFRMLLSWRIHLRHRLKMVKNAKVAEKFLKVRSAWRVWKAALEKKRREQKLKAFERGVAKQFFEVWHARAARQRQHKIAEETVRERVNLRIMSSALAHWTNRVAHMKFRELETAQQYDMKLVGAALMKWKNICIRHVEDLSLMDSFMLVRREDTLRRFFCQWRVAAIKAGRHRILLEEKEEEWRRRLIAGAWDKWRERYQHNRLQPLADTFIAQHKKDPMFRTFAIWRSRTKPLPAVRFHSERLKAKVWKKWRDAMPEALQSKQARDIDRRALLVRYFERWAEAYQTRIQLQAVKRARYLRLPTTASRQTVPPLASSSRPNTAAAPSSSSMFPRRTTRPPSPSTAEESDTASEAPIPAPRPARPLHVVRPKPGIASLLTTRSRSPVRQTTTTVEPSRPKSTTGSRFSRPRDSVAALPRTREPSPARSVAATSVVSRRTALGAFPRVTAGPPPPSISGQSTGNRLWQELQQLRLKSDGQTRTRSNTTYSRTDRSPTRDL